MFGYKKILSVRQETLFKIRDICLEKRLAKVNAMFHYMDSHLTMIDKNKLYNGLTYIGEFETYYNQ